MSIKSTIITLALAAAVTVATAAAALAGPAMVKYDTTLYANAGWGQIGFVHGGQWVDVQGCNNGYCWVSKPGRDGFVKAFALNWADSGYDQGYGGYDHNHGGYGFGWGFGFGSGYGHGHGPVHLLP